MSSLYINGLEEGCAHLPDLTFYTWNEVETWTLIKGVGAWHYHFGHAPNRLFADQIPFWDKVTLSSWWGRLSTSFANGYPQVKL